jgi:hypothetical protein
MAASSFALACDALARERDRVFIMRVSTDYKIDFTELEAKYLVEAETAIKVPKQKKARVAKVSVEGGKPVEERCQALTAKKGQCSFSSLKGECFCKRHLKQQNEPKQDVPKAVKPVSKKPPAKVEPVHEHELDGEKHADCNLCQTHGSVLTEEKEFEEASEPAPEPVEAPKHVTEEDLTGILARWKEEDPAGSSDDEEDLIEEKEFEDAVASDTESGEESGFDEE